MWSPGSTATVFPTTTRPTKISTTATTIATMWPSSFWTAIARRVTGVAATNSMLPRRASPASVPDSARIDHRLATSGKNVPYLYCMYPPSVSTATGRPARPCRIGGTARIRSPSS